MFRDWHDYRQYFHARPGEQSIKLMHEIRTMRDIRAIIGAALGERLYETMIRRQRLKHTTGEICPLRLVRRHCRGPRCMCNSPSLREAFDHRELYIRDGRPAAFIAHPYALNGPQVVALEGFCKSNGLEVTITSQSWYYYGMALLVWIRRAGE